MKRKKSIRISIKIFHNKKIILEKDFGEFPISFGRSRNNQVSLMDQNLISRKHASLDWDGEQLILKDLNSSNGIFVNKKRVPSVIIDKNKVIHIGELEIHMEPQYYLESSIPQHEKDDNQISEETKTTDISSLFDLNQETDPQSGNETVGTRSANSPQVECDEIEASRSFEQVPALPSKDEKPVTSFAPKGLEQDGGEALQRPKRVSSENPLLGSFKRPYENIHRFSKAQTNLEMTVMWKGQIYQSQIFRPGESIKLGRGSRSTYLPTLKKEYHLADYDGNYAHCYLSKGMKGNYIRPNSQPQSLEKILPPLKSKGKHRLKINSTDVCHIHMGENIDIFLRYTPAPRQLTKNRLILPEKLLKKTIIGSGVGHLMAVMFMFLLAPKESDIRIRNIPPRIARLLVQKPKPKPKPIVKKEEKVKKVEKKVVQNKKPVVKKKVKIVKRVKKVKKKTIRKPQRVIVRKTQKMKKINEQIRLPKVVRKKKDIKSLGALAALGSQLSSNKILTNKPISLNINPNAGSTSSKINTTGVIGALKTKNGQLQSLSMKGVKTQGRGYGKGSGYGVQGLKGQAGSRGVAGVVNQPKLLKVKSSEGLTKSQVMSEVQRHIGRIQSCYERALLSAPGISGRVEYQWYITPRGKVKWSKVKNSEISNGGALNSCVKKVFRKMKFPVAKNGEATVPSIGFPFGRI